MLMPGIVCLNLEIHLALLRNRRSYDLAARLVDFEGILRCRAFLEIFLLKIQLAGFKRQKSLLDLAMKSKSTFTLKKLFEFLITFIFSRLSRTTKTALLLKTR